jgi:PilZ domain
MRKPRFRLNLAVEWRLAGSVTRYRTTTRDVSESGVLMETLTRPPIGATVVLRLGARCIPLAGTVARGDHAGVAVRFADPLDAARKRLRRYLRTLDGRIALSST